MGATWMDYRWLDDDEFAGWIENGYCLTLVRDARSADVIELLGGRAAGEVTGLAGLAAPAQAARSGGVDRLVVGLVELDGWTAMIEDNGYVGVSGSMAPVSAVHDTISTFGNVNALSGVRITPELLRSARLHLVTVPIPTS